VNFITFVLAVLLFPLWFPVAAFFFVGIGVPWIIGYPIACTAHLLYTRARHGKWVRWQLLYPGQ
jgi:hypothetical protein